MATDKDTECSPSLIFRRILLIATLSGLGFWMSVNYGTSLSDSFHQKSTIIGKWAIFATLVFFALLASFPILGKSTKFHIKHYASSAFQWIAGAFIISASYLALNKIPPECPKLAAGIVIFMIVGFVGVLIGNYFPFLSFAPEEPPLPQDKLHRSHFVKSFTYLLSRNFKNEKPELRRIAITGPWGVGKTDFIERVRIELAKENKDKIVTAMVNPWRTKNKTEAHQCLVSGIDQALSIWRPSKGIAMTLFSVASKVLGKTPSLKTLTALKELNPAKSRSSLQQVNTWLEEEKRSVIVFVDDMERTNLKTLRSILPVIDQLGELSRCVFVFAIDRTRIEKAFKDSEEANGFLRKVFDTQMELPSPTQRELAKLAQDIVQESQYPLLYSSLENFRGILPASPRALKQWLNRCQLEEEMFFQKASEKTKRKFAVFFLHRLIDYEFPGFSEYCVSDYGLTLAEKAGLTRYESQMSRILGGDRPKKNETVEPATRDENLVEGFFLRYAVSPKERLRKLFSEYQNFLKNENIKGQYSTEWVCREYKLVTEFNTKNHMEILKLFLESPTQKLSLTIKEFFKKTDEDHVDLHGVEMNFFSNFLSESIHNQLRYGWNSIEEMESAKTNLEKLIQYIESIDLETAPSYITEGIPRSILESHGMLTNIKDVKVTDLFLDLDKKWLDFTSFHWISSLLSRVHRDPQPFDLGVHHDGDHAWLLKFKSHLRDRLTSEFSILTKSETFANDYSHITTISSAVFFLHPEIYFNKKQLLHLIAGEKFSSSFMSECMYGMFGVEVEKGDSTPFFRAKMKPSNAFSFLALSCAPEIPSDVIERYRENILKIYHQIKGEKVRDWFKQNFLGKQVANYFNSDFEQIDLKGEKNSLG